jgi:hypothetical protein
MQAEIAGRTKRKEVRHHGHRRGFMKAALTLVVEIHRRRRRR